MYRRASILAAAAAAVLLSTPGWAQDVKAFEKNLAVHKLKNGLTVLIYNRPVAPVFSFFTHVDVGGAQEVPGITGLAQTTLCYDQTLADVRRKVALDLQYISRQSTLEDLWIMLRTPLVMLGAKRGW